MVGHSKGVEGERVYIEGASGRQFVVEIGRVSAITYVRSSEWGVSRRSCSCRQGLKYKIHSDCNKVFEYTLYLRSGCTHRHVLDEEDGKQLNITQTAPKKLALDEGR